MLCSGGRCDNKTFEYSVYRASINVFKEHGHWSGWFSEENKGRTCDPGRAVRQIQCRYSQCDEMRILCAGVKEQFRVSDAATSNSNWFSEEDGWHYCGGGQTHWLIGLGCRSRYCDEIQLRCALIERKDGLFEALPEDIIA